MVAVATTIGAGLLLLAFLISVRSRCVLWRAGPHALAALPRLCSAPRAQRNVVLVFIVVGCVHTSAPKLPCWPDERCIVVLSKWPR